MECCKKTTNKSVEAALVRLQTGLSAKARQRSADPGLAELVREVLPPFRGQLNALDEQVHTDFDVVEAHLRGKNLPPEIIRRHREAVAAYDREMHTLQGNLDNIAGIAEKTPQNIQITPEIEALAQELQHHPVKIYNWTVSNICFIPYWGSIHGSRMTLETKSVGLWTKLTI